MNAITSTQYVNVANSTELFLANMRRRELSRAIEQFVNELDLVSQIEFISRIRTVAGYTLRVGLSDECPNHFTAPELSPEYQEFESILSNLFGSTVKVWWKLTHSELIIQVELV